MKMGYSLPGDTTQLFILAFTIDLRNYSVLRKVAHDEHKEYRFMKDRQMSKEADRATNISTNRRIKILNIACV